MISKEHLEKLCDQYSIGEAVSISNVAEGVLNQNYILTTTKGKYFIKSVREKIKSMIPYVYSVESLMSERGVPAVVMLKTQKGEVFVSCDDRVYTVYPFIESDRRHVYSSLDYHNMGAMLARIHLAGGKDIDNGLKENAFSTSSRPREDIMGKLLAYEKQIESKADSKDSSDIDFLKYIRYKIGVIDKMSEAPLDLNDTIVHGDFHAGNLLIDPDNRDIVGVCDWEKAVYGSRYYEIARSVIYICFDQGFEQQKAIDCARDVLRGYMSVYTIDPDDFRAGFSSRLRRMALSLWIENKHYKDNDTRADKFVRNEMLIMKLFIDEGFDPLNLLPQNQ